MVILWFHYTLIKRASTSERKTLGFLETELEDIQLKHFFTFDVRKCKGINRQMDNQTVTHSNVTKISTTATSLEQRPCVSGEYAEFVLNQWGYSREILAKNKAMTSQLYTVRVELNCGVFRTLRRCHANSVETRYIFYAI